MTPQRFEALAEAYGGDITRWPTDEREAALRLAAAESAATALALARRLDATLALAPSPVLGAALRDRILSAAPVARASRMAWRWLTGAGVGAALAAACAGGVAVGAFIVPPQMVGSAQAALTPGDEATQAAADLPDLGDAR